MTTIIGTNFADNIRGRRGDDFITCGCGNNSINGSAGDDVLFGDKGSDTLIGEPDMDTLVAYEGNQGKYQQQLSPELLHQVTYI
ncbi:MAG: hypothetical protein VKL59_13965 [Nostocaceae cyanobacterium]|nr:hypothetical protein [Nostocaceae cyanobacterium]